MKIFYAVQATGNGHISRAQHIYPYLKKYGEVDFFLSGNNSNLDVAIPIKYRSKGCSLHYNECGGLDYMAILKNIKTFMILNDAYSLPLHQYDIVINDFDFVTSLSCKLKNIPSVQFGHQASFQSSATPRPDNKSKVGEVILKNYALATNYIGLHFQKYDQFIFPPVIKDDFINANVIDLKHVTVYLPSFQKKCLLEAFGKLKHIQFHWFLEGIESIYYDDNIVYYPINQKLFNDSLVSCHGLITGGGFETPSEALYLNKKLISIPIQSHYEQACNAYALKKMGVLVLESVGEDFYQIINKWYESENSNPKIKSNNIHETLNFLIDTYPKKNKSNR